MQNTIIFTAQKDIEYGKCVFQNAVNFTLTYL